MPFIPCGFTLANRAHRDTDARQVHKNTGVLLPSHVHTLFLCAFHAHPHTQMNSQDRWGVWHGQRWTHAGISGFLFQLLDLSSWTSCSHFPQFAALSCCFLNSVCSICIPYKTSNIYLFSRSNVPPVSSVLSFLCWVLTLGLVIKRLVTLIQWACCFSNGLGGAENIKCSLIL